MTLDNLVGKSVIVIVKDVRSDNLKKVEGIIRI